MGNYHAPFWIGGGGSNPFADHTRSVPVLAKAMSAPMRITVVLDRMRIVSAEYDYVGTNNCAQIWLMKRSGMRSVDS
jgi:hypothetical protein